MEQLIPGNSLSGFTVISRTELPEYQGIGIRLRHTATGLDLFHISNDDPENLFSFIFKTPPRNNNGTAHIVEHSVLAGSKNFPVKDPFLELMKGSAQTFLNAMTYPDKTVYPAASPLKQDYYNLFSVYADAVFFPLLRKEVYQQEGIRLVKEGPKGHLSYDGIVFNEMRGAYSDHEAILSACSHRSLFPDTPYGYDSGGMPESIINLSYEEFKGFHAEYYHPSNCRIFLYGNIPTEEQLIFLEENYLHEFTEIKTDSTIIEPKSWNSPKVLKYTSPGMEESSAGSATLNWIAGSTLNPVDIMTLEVLVETLLGNPGAPLYRAVIESGLGMDLASISGMATEYREIVFTVGIKGIDPEKSGEFESMILETLKKVFEEGLDPEEIDSAVKRIEFQQRELRGGIPIGLRAMSRCLRGWLHGADPESTIQFDEVIKEVKRRIQRRKKYLEKYLKEYLIDNPHRSLVVVTPTVDHIEKQNGRISKAAAEREFKADKRFLKQLIEDRKQLEHYYAEQESPEDLERVPSLSIDEMPKQVSRIATLETTFGKIPGYRHEFFTNGIVYLDGAFTISGLSNEEFLLLPLFNRLLVMTALPGMSYEQTSRLIAQNTGGFYTFLDAVTPVGGANPEVHLFFRCKMLEKDMVEGINLVGRLLTETEINDPKRIRAIISELISDYSSEIIPSGNAYASLRAASRLSGAVRLEEHWKGIEQLKFLQSLRDADDKEVERLGKLLISIRDLVINQDSLVCNSTTDEKGQESLIKETESFIEQIAKRGVRQFLSVQIPFSTDEKISFESIVTSTDVAFNSLVIKAPGIGDPGQEAFSILALMLSTNLLWERIRVRGGAYGAHAEMNIFEGLFSITSYRDPRISGTFKDFRESLELMAEGAFPRSQMEKAIISLISKDLRPQKPREMTLLGFRRKLYRVEDTLRQKRREAFIQLEPTDISNAAQRLMKAIEAGNSAQVSIAGSSLIEAEKGHSPFPADSVEQIVLS